MKSKVTGPVLAVVTMRDGISLADFVDIADKTELTIISYGVFGANSDGQQISVYVWPMQDQEFGFPAEEGIKYQGIHTFTALADLEALDTLQDNPNVVLVDLSANQIKDEIRARLGESIDITQVGIPNPSWYIVSGELKLP
jgi:hypothetical protein